MSWRLGAGLVSLMSLLSFESLAAPGLRTFLQSGKKIGSAVSATLRQIAAMTATMAGARLPGAQPPALPRQPPQVGIEGNAVVVREGNAGNGSTLTDLKIRFPDVRFNRITFFDPDSNNRTNVAMKRGPNGLQELCLTQGALERGQGAEHRWDPNTGALLSAAVKGHDLYTWFQCELTGGSDQRGSDQSGSNSYRLKADIVDLRTSEPSACDVTLHLENDVLQSIKSLQLNPDGSGTVLARIISNGQPELRAIAIGQ